jgi:membrane-bound ClpP family serine protease
VEDAGLYDSVGMTHIFLEILTWLGLVIGFAGMVLMVLSVAVAVADETGVLDRTNGPLRNAHP